MAKINAINNKCEELTIDPGASGDSFLQFDINTTGEWRIGCDDTDDSFRISQGSALGTNDTFIMTDAGERTMPLQPAFLGYHTLADSNVTGDGSVYTLGSGNALSEIFDQGGDFVTSGTFTAPVDGRYYFSMSMQISGLASGHNGEMRLVTSNGTYKLYKNNTVSMGSTVEYTSCAFVDMDASDTATATLDIAGGAKTVDVAAGTLGAGAPTWFSGYLVA